MFVTLTATKHLPVDQQHKSFARTVSLGSHFKENLQQTHFQLFCRHLASFLNNKGTIESNKLNFMMKYHFDVLPTKFELATLNNN